MRVQRFGSPDGGQLVLQGFSSSLGRPSYGAMVRLNTGIDCALTVKPKMTLAEFESAWLPDHVTVRSVTNFDLAGRRVAVADLAFASQWGTRQVRWAAWEGVTGIVQSAWDAVSAEEALHRIDLIGPSDGANGPVVSAPFLHTKRGLRCLFPPVADGWLVIERRWPDQTDMPSPVAPGKAVPGGQMFQSTGASRSPSLTLLSDSNCATFVQAAGITQAAATAVRQTTVSWSSPRAGG